MGASAIISVAIYLALLVWIALGSRKKHQSSNDFILGSRKMNFWLTALAAHASDMSSWIFMGYPAAIYGTGLFSAWAAIGLTTFMFLNWQFVAPRLRTMTESYNSLTISSFFESRFADVSGSLRVFTALISLVYYTIYISAGLVALGILIHTLFGIDYFWGISIGIFIIVPYLFVGGYVTLAWTDLFQGIFLMFAIVIVPIAAYPLYAAAPASAALDFAGSREAFLPDLEPYTLLSIAFLVCGWGLGYFGQPHILTKFMGIDDVKNMAKSKWVGISWQTISLTAATFVGVIGVKFFSSPLVSDELVFIDMVTSIFPSVIAAFILCAILGATITCMDSQILVLASNLTEDFYKKLLRKTASSKELLVVSRASIFLIALISYVIACNTSSTIYSIVSYAWFGLGASFGPLVLFSLFSKNANRYGAWGGVLTGALVAGVWPLINNHFEINVPTLIPGFLISCFTIWTVSSITQIKNTEAA